MQIERISVLAGNISKDGQIVINRKNGKLVSILNNFNSNAYYSHFAKLLGDRRRSAVIGSFHEQEKKRSWPPDETEGVRYL